jgi:hypothetical protein
VQLGFRLFARNERQNKYEHYLIQILIAPLYHNLAIYVQGADLYRLQLVVIQQALLPRFQSALLRAIHRLSDTESLATKIQVEKQHNSVIAPEFEKDLFTGGASFCENTFQRIDRIYRILTSR